MDKLLTYISKKLPKAQQGKTFPVETLERRKKVYKTIRPSDYFELTNYVRFLANNERDDFDDPRSEEAFRMYLGLENKPKYFTPSKYRPTINADPKTNMYYQVDPQLEQEIFDSFKDKVKMNQILPANEVDVQSYFDEDETGVWEENGRQYKALVPFDDNIIFGRPMVSNARALGNFVVSRGKDKKGEYLSYSDQYDFPEWMQKQMQGQPYKIYGRVYYPQQKKQYGGVPVTSFGQYAYPGFDTIVPTPTGKITMKDVPYPVYGQDETGYGQMMMPGGEYKFPGQLVYEKPIMQRGGPAPIYVDNPRDPRLRAYNDSLRLYNTEAAYRKQFRKSYTPAQKKAFYKAQEANYNFGDIGKSNRILPVSDLLSVNFIAPDGSPDYINTYKKPVQPVIYRKPEPVPAPVAKPAAVQQAPTPRANYFQGTPVYAPTPYAGSGAGAFVGYRSAQGDTVYVKPQDYERMGVPAYGKQFIESRVKKQNGGEKEEPTVMSDKILGRVVTPQSKKDLRPVYRNFQSKFEDVYDPNCPDGVGCSKQATVNAQKITGLPYQAYAPADAAYRDAVSRRYGLKNIFDQEGRQKVNADSFDKDWKFPTDNDFSKWKAGDIVTLDAGNDIYFPYNAPPGFTNADNASLTHNGTIVGFTEGGRPIIKHGYADGKYRGKSITEVLGKDNRVSDVGHGRYAVKSVWRPKEVDEDNTINKVSSVIDKGTDAARRKQQTTSGQYFYLKNTPEQDLSKEYPVAAEFSGANSRLRTKEKLVELFNNESLDKELQYKLGMTAEEIDNIKPVIYGVFGQETNFNDIDNIGAATKEAIGNTLGRGSRGPAQIKLGSLTKQERKVLGVKRASDLEKDDVAYKAAMLLLNNARKRMNLEVEQGTHPELADANEFFRAGYYYNSPARAVSSAKDWSKKSKPVTLNPLTWFNKLSTRERGLLGGIDPNYSDRIELRMDPGSYPYKLMERARDLGVGVDFEKEQTLEPIVIRSGPKGSKFEQFKSGGQHGGLDRWFAEKWVDVKTGKTCGRQEGENRSYPACRPSRRVSSETPKTSSEMSPSEKAKFKRTKTSSQRIPYNHKRAQWGAQVSSEDSIRNIAGNILKYEQLRGGPGGAPLPQYSDPKYMQMLMQNIYPEVKKIMPKASAMETGEAMDFIFNAGWDKGANKILKDPRAYALQEYYRQYDPSKLDASGNWSGRKNPAYSFDQEYASTIGKLSENQRRVLMNKGRDWYYRNINNPTPGVPNDDYYNTWYGRIWNTNDYAPFNPNNSKFIYKKK
jgi:hypothetical protein